jgi:hypothetical protein
MSTYVGLAVITYFLSRFTTQLVDDNFWWILLVNTILLGLYGLVIFRTERKVIMSLLRPVTDRDDILDAK